MSTQKTKELPDYLDYNRLKELGISYLQAVEGNIWTDFNIKDPGVTILELLCWSLMDLGYRTSFEIKDLLTHKGSEGPSTDGGLLPAHEILSCNPVTCDDYKKLVLENIPQVRNIWFEPSTRMVAVRGVEGMADKTIPVNGFYKLGLDFYDGADEKELVKEVLQLFHTHRNLCENLLTSDIRVAAHVDVGICAEIEIERDADICRIFNAINARVSEYVCPSVCYHSLSEMISSGKTPDRIFQSANPKYGFIDMDELKACRKRTELYTSDVLNLIMGIDGVRSVSHLHFTVSPESMSYVDCPGDWKLSLKQQDEEDHTVYFSFRRWPELVSGRTAANGASRYSFSENGLSGFIVKINGLPFRLGEEIPLWSAGSAASVSGREPVKDFSVKMPQPEGTYRFTDRYFSIQNNLPEIYRLGRGGISEKASSLRKGQRLQFKAYLLLFEQIISDYLAQLSSIDRLFSWKDQGEDYDLTYFSGALSEEEIKDLSAVLKGYGNYQKSVYPETVVQERRNRFLDHLLARFNEEFIDYSIFNFWNSNAKQTADFDVSQSVRDKKAYLAGYVTFSAGRFKSTDLSSEWSYSPVERRIMSKLGIDSVRTSLAPELISSEGEMSIFRDNASESYNEAFGLHIIEHPLLTLGDGLSDADVLKLSVSTDGRQYAEDPYSMQVTAVVPGWLDICRKSFFRRTVERVIREELPAHISVKICWIDPLAMSRIEKAYSSYIPSTLISPDKKSLCELVSIMNDIHSIYPSTLLGDSSFETGTRVGSSVLGSDMNMRKGRCWAFESGKAAQPSEEVKAMLGEVIQSLLEHNDKR